MNIKFLIRRCKESIFHRIIAKYSLISSGNYKAKGLLFSKDIKMNLFGSKDIISDHIAYLGYYEWELSNLIKRLSIDSSLMVDAGANMGYFSLIFLANSKSGKVISFEPNPSVFKLLETNLDINMLCDRATIYKKALSFESGVLNFSFGSNNLQSGWGHVSSSSENTITSHNLDDLYLEDSIIDILKIDVEGFEYEVLMGSEKLLQTKRIKNIFFEINDELLRMKNLSGKFVIEYLKNFGYQVDFITDEIAWAKI